MQLCCVDVIFDETVRLVFSYARFPMVLNFTALFGCQTVLLRGRGLDVLTGGSDACRGQELVVCSVLSVTVLLSTLELLRFREDLARRPSS